MGRRPQRLLPVPGCGPDTRSWALVGSAAGPRPRGSASAPGGKPQKGTYPAHLGEGKGRRGRPCTATTSPQVRPARCTAPLRPVDAASGLSGPPAGGRTDGPGPLTVVPHRHDEEQQEGGSLDSSQEEEVIVQMAAVNVPWGRRERHVSCAWVLPKVSSTTFGPEQGQGDFHLRLLRSKRLKVKEPRVSETQDTQRSEAGCVSPPRVGWGGPWRDPCPSNVSPQKTKEEDQGAAATRPVSVHTPRGIRAVGRREACDKASDGSADWTQQRKSFFTSSCSRPEKAGK